MIKKSLNKTLWLFASQFGLNPLHLFRSIRAMPRFLNDWLRFRESYSGPLTWMPCLHDRYQEACTTKSEYFWQDLLVARWIFDAKPQKHVDVGSRVDGFVAHVAAFRQIEVFDVRPITVQIPGVVFKQADFMRIDSLPKCDGGYCDSLSSLHAIEHFGLGRYGDPIDPVGHERAITNMTLLLKSNARFYLSAPIGRERVEFNAMRVLDPLSIILFIEQHGLELNNLTVISAGGVIRQVPLTATSLKILGGHNYNLGLFVFIKK